MLLMSGFSKTAHERIFFAAHERMLISGERKIDLIKLYNRMLLQANLGLNVDFWHFISPLGLFKAYFRPYFPNIETFNDPSGYFRPILGNIYRFLRFLMTPRAISTFLCAFYDLTG